MSQICFSRAAMLFRLIRVASVASLHPPENLLDSLRRRRQTVFQNHFTCLIQDAVMACAVSQVHADGQPGLIENHVPARRHSANLLYSRSPFSCALSTSIIGSVSYPVETGLLIPSGKFECIDRGRRAWRSVASNVNFWAAGMQKRIARHGQLRIN